jgi:hypothetical protein
MVCSTGEEVEREDAFVTYFSFPGGWKVVLPTVVLFAGQRLKSRGETA